ncbi:MAG TPA: hypothetical protein VLN59_18335 [Burkholderiales bacterium]|nr:hypothetical protein [Burkholderiales bacterium]
MSAQRRTDRAPLVEAPEGFDEFNRFVCERRWGDGLPVVPATEERVSEMLRHTKHARDEVIAVIAPNFGAATTERIAINAVMAGCVPELLPVVIAAVEAAVAPEFNLQGVQATTNPVATWIIVNGPLAATAEFNATFNCLGPGARANATLGRALRLVLQNVGGALPGEMDRATQGQPGKYTFCCAENEAESPWEPLHVERGVAREGSAVTVVGAAGTVNMNTHAKDANDLLRVIADTMIHPTSNDYWIGGEPWIVLSPEHAHVLHREGLTKADVKRELWERSKMAAGRMAAKDLSRTRVARTAELGPVTEETLLPITVAPESIGIIVAGGPGTHSVYVPSFGDTRAVTREIEG